MKAQEDVFEERENRNVTGMSERYIPASRPAKTHQDYWKTKLKHPTFKGRDGTKYTPAEWYVRMFHLKREVWFCLDTANQAVAAVKARDIYLSLVSAGWEPTLAKYKPSAPVKVEVCTLGEFLEDVKTHGHFQPRTARIYETKLRKLVGDIANVEAGMKAKFRRLKHDYIKGGRLVWLAKIDGVSLDLLTPDSVSLWRNTYVAKAGADPLKRKSAERTAASILRAGRSLFSQESTRVLKVKLPPNPFAGVKVRDPGPQRYHSTVNPEWLLACAERELRTAEPQQYLGLFLCLWAGLRRKEADLLTWAQLDFERGELHVRRTEYFEPKTEESQRVIDLAPQAVEVLRSFKKGAVGEFVMVGWSANPSALYGYYRCDRTWRHLSDWLKSKGVAQRSAIHTLRKESGSLIASTYGIEAARQHLGHRDISTTSAHYVDKKKRIEVKLPLKAELHAVGPDGAVCRA
jgi:integrase